MIVILFIVFISGETGIRTPGASQHNGFQDRRNRPLCHLSNISNYHQNSFRLVFCFDYGCKDSGLYNSLQIFRHLFSIIFSNH